MAFSGLPGYAELCVTVRAAHLRLPDLSQTSGLAATCAPHPWSLGSLPLHTGILASATSATVRFVDDYRIELIERAPGD